MVRFIHFTLVGTLVLFASAHQLLAQNKAKIDSLENLFSKTESVTKKSDLLITLFHSNENIQKKKEIAKRGQELIVKFPSDSIAAINVSYMELFIVAHDSSITPSMIQRGIELEKKTLKYPISLSQKVKILNLLADLYQRSNQIEKSIEYSFKSIEMTENGIFETEEKKQKLLAISYMNLANRLGIIKDKKSLDYATKAIKILENSDLKDKKLTIGMYGNYTISLRRAGLYDSALVYAKKMEKVLAPSDKAHKAKLFELIATIYMEMNDYNNSKIYAQKSVQLAKEQNIALTSVMASYTLGKSYKKLEQYDSAIILFEQTLQKATKLKLAEILINTHRELANSYQKKGNMEKAFQSLKLATNYEDSVAKIRRERETKELTVKYETEKKEADIQRLNQEAKIKDLELKNSYYLTIGAVVLAVLILIAIWIFFRQKNIIDTFEKEQAKLRWRRAQINPHFFFNVLSAIQMLVLEGEKQKVSKYITGFSYLMRQVLEGSNQEKVSVEEEIKFIQTYLTLEKLSLDFDFEIKCNPEELEIEDIFIPAMLLQPFVENAIEHGLRKSTKTEKKLDIIFTEINQNKLQISIKDNGAGRNDKRKSNHISRALEITQDRKKLMKDAFDYEIIDHKEEYQHEDENQNSLGTEVVFTIKI